MRATSAASTARSPSGSTSTAAVGLIATSSPLAAISSVTRSRPPANPTPGVDGQPSASARPGVGLPALEVGRAAGRVAETVERQEQGLAADLVHPLGWQLDHLCVQPRRRASDRFHVALEDLPVAALLWPVVTEHRTEQIKTRGLRTLVEAAFEVSAHQSRGRLRSQGQVSPSAVVETIKLFG